MGCEGRAVVVATSAAPSYSFQREAPAAQLCMGNVTAVSLLGYSLCKVSEAFRGACERRLEVVDTASSGGGGGLESSHLLQRCMNVVLCVRPC